MYASLLSYPQLRSYLELLLKGDLLTYDYKSFSITKSGRKFLELYNELIKLILITTNQRARSSSRNQVDPQLSKLQFFGS
jgi:hypothetical protein